MQHFSLLMLCGVCLASAALPACAQPGGFGFTQTDGRVVVDTGAELVFSVDTRNGDLVSMRYRGNELQTLEAKGSQIASGLGAAHVETKTVGDVIVITAQAGDLTHYYLAHRDRNAIYMATYAPTLLPVGELRFVARFNVSKLPKAAQGTDSNVGQAIEGKDVFLLADGRTSSKFYSARPMIDDALHGVSGPGVAVYMLMGNRELSAGGPFFKDIATQKTATTHEMYNYMFSNHTQTEAYRGGLHGVYGLLFTDAGPPSSALTDLRFVNNSLGLRGYVDSAARGSVSAHLSGVAPGLPALIGLSNASAQYWARADARGDAQLTGVRAGQYRTTLYQNELEVARGSVDVKTGSLAHTELNAQPTAGRMNWQIGVPDGTPTGFLNANQLTSAHPSDARMAAWKPLTYTVGSSAISEFPAAQWRDVNSPTRIDFMLGANEVHDYRLRLYVSLEQAGGRPRVTVNHTWEAPVAAASNQPESRGITRGTYRGNNTLFEINVPRTALHAGQNSLEIDVASGKTGSGFLSPGFVYDSVQWVSP
ncbi:rhamnogalacturonan lyase B N-terminal domain-containing protein [Pseudomonas sp. MPB26]|uniref:rhamnogalacturonan lyase B N-terminal domain-containing protein n=1 Tax=Pseudomonas sp. MPB26 TaxID=3388491 RepID=UPI003984D374